MLQNAVHNARKCTIGPYWHFRNCKFSLLTCWGQAGYRAVKVGSHSLWAESNKFSSSLPLQKKKQPNQLIHYHEKYIFPVNYISSRGISDNSGAYLTLRTKPVDFSRDNWNAEVFFKCYTLVSIDHEDRIHRWKTTLWKVKHYCEFVYRKSWPIFSLLTNLWFSPLKKFSKTCSDHKSVAVTKPICLIYS